MRESDFKRCDYDYIEDIASFDPDKYFEDYDHFESYVQDSHLQYFNEPFEANYNGQEKRTYRHVLYKIGSNQGTLKFVVAEEILSDEERKKLGRYCRCEVCKMSFLKPAKYFTCAHCFGCIKADGENQYVIKATRKYMQEKKKKNGN